MEMVWIDDDRGSIFWPSSLMRNKAYEKNFEVNNQGGFIIPIENRCIQQVWRWPKQIFLHDMFFFSEDV